MDTKPHVITLTFPLELAELRAGHGEPAPTVQYWEMVISVDGDPKPVLLHRTEDGNLQAILATVGDVLVQNSTDPADLVPIDQAHDLRRQRRLAQQEGTPNAQ